MKTDEREKLVPAVYRERCKACGICAHFCPKDAIETDEQGIPHLIDPDACNSCGRCEQLCPDFAMKLIPPDEAEKRRAEQRDAEGEEHPTAEPEVCHPLEPCEG